MFSRACARILLLVSSSNQAYDFLEAVLTHKQPCHSCKAISWVKLRYVGVSLEHGICIALRRIIDIWVIQ